jgi:hypothetical protein
MALFYSIRITSSFNFCFKSILPAVNCEIFTALKVAGAIEEITIGLFRAIGRILFFRKKYFSVCH